MLDYLYEMKTSRRNSTLDSQQFRKEDAKKIFLQDLKIQETNKREFAKPIEMESVHVDLQARNGKKRVFSFLRKNKKDKLI
ncbi:MAG: hypothetical protein ACPKM0_09435 [Pleomorphochaeta sp.]